MASGITRPGAAVEDVAAARPAASAQADAASAIGRLLTTGGFDAQRMPPAGGSGAAGHPVTKTGQKMAGFWGHSLPDTRRGEIEMPAHVPPVADEREALLAFLDHQRQGLRTAAHGLTDLEAAAAPSASALTLGGLLKHLASVERYWMSLVTGQSLAQEPDAYLEGFRMRPDETLAQLLANYEAAALETEKVVAGIDDLGRPVPVPPGVPWMPQDVDAWSVRWVLLHLIEETARHAGHADVVRESLDGANAVSLQAAAEGWPAADWVTPGQRQARETEWQR